MLLRTLHRCALAGVIALSVLPALTQAGALTDLLIAKIGVTQPQADGGAGSIFKLARAQMTPENFQKLRSVIPGLDNYLGAAPAFLPGEAGGAQGLGKVAAAAGLASGAAEGGKLAAGGSPSAALAANALTGGSSQSALAAAALGGATTGSALVTAAGGTSSSGALAAAALGQPASTSDVLKGAARDKLAESVGASVATTQGGVAGLAAGALTGNNGAGSLGAATSLLAGTALGDKLASVQALAPAFQQLGMKQGMIAQFLPVVLDYVKSVGGKSSSKLLTHALGL